MGKGWVDSHLSDSRAPNPPMPNQMFALRESARPIASATPHAGAHDGGSQARKPWRARRSSIWASTRARRCGDALDARIGSNASNQRTMSASSGWPWSFSCVIPHLLPQTLPGVLKPAVASIDAYTSQKRNSLYNPFVTHTCLKNVSLLSQLAFFRTNSPGATWTQTCIARLSSTSISGKDRVLRNIMHGTSTT